MSILSGQRALITGGSRGIGRGTAIELAKAGANVVINYRSHPDEAEDVCQACRQQGVEATAIRADLGHPQQVAALVEQAEQALGGLDIVVSNAAYSDRQLFYEADLEGFQRTIDVTMWGPFHLLRAAAPRMMSAERGGNIVVISSPHANLAMPGSMAYNMAKAAIDQMARTAAVELASHGIRVNIVHPGWIDTPGERKFFSEETLREQGEKLPLGRMGRIDEIGRGVVFLCDPGNQYITGSTLTIDGGIQLPWREMYRTQEKPAGAN